MPLSDITADSIRQAILEFDRLGREEFLRQYKFGKARGYFLLQNGVKYDSKAIVGVAHGYLKDSHPLTPYDFIGGDKTVAKLLTGLGFKVLTPRDNLPEGIPFETGLVYHRQRDIHQVYGGQERGGIATPDSVPYVFLFTGESGQQYGYSDGWRADGVYDYTGEGQTGDMQFVRGNRAIRDHASDGCDLLLFEATPTKGLYRFVGSFASAGWDFRASVDRDGKDRKAIVFQLVPVTQVGTGEAKELSQQAPPTEALLSELRQQAYAASAAPAGNPKDVRRNYYERSARVKAYVLARAAGSCEACGKEAPFRRKNGTPYLEPHHTRRVADGGPDHPQWVGAVCPSCHREIHHGENGEALNQKLEAYLKKIEAAGGPAKAR